MAKCLIVLGLLCSVLYSMGQFLLNTIEVETADSQAVESRDAPQQIVWTMF